METASTLLQLPERHLCSFNGDGFHNEFQYCGCRSRKRPASKTLFKIVREVQGLWLDSWACKKTVVKNEVSRVIFYELLSRATQAAAKGRASSIEKSAAVAGKVIAIAKAIYAISKKGGRKDPSTVAQASVLTEELMGGFKKCI